MNEFAQSKTGTDGVRGSCSSPRERGERRSKRDAAPPRRRIRPCAHPTGHTRTRGAHLIRRRPRRKAEKSLRGLLVGGPMLGCVRHTVSGVCLSLSSVKLRLVTYSETVPLTLKDEQRGSRKRTPVCVWSLEWLQNRLGALAASSTLSICSICRSLFPEPSTIA